ncbi:MAG: B-box zinc finger protein [Promethearchaeota archaeon]
MSELSCYYHPQDKAKEKCKTCGKPLCEECSTKHWHVCGMPPLPEKYQK